MLFVYFSVAIALACLSEIPAQNVRTVQELVTRSRVRRSNGDDDKISEVGRLPTDSVRETHEEKVDHGQCGRVDVQPNRVKRVTQGERAERGKWPWHIALYHYVGANPKYRGGGTLIGRRTVLTVAHVVTNSYNDSTVDPESLAVYLGKHHLKLWSGIQEKQVSEIWVHPDYNVENYTADIAILILSSPVDYTVDVRPACLWDKNKVTATGVPGTVVGWGKDETGEITGHLMTAKMPIVSDIECIRSYPEFFSKFLNGKNFCAGYRNGTSACTGDNGGGMFFPILHAPDRVNTWYLRGIVSLSPAKQDSNLCDPTHFVVFTDVSEYLDWIKRYLR